VKRLRTVLLGTAILAVAIAVVSYRSLGTVRGSAARGPQEAMAVAEPAQRGSTDEPSRDVGRLRGEVALLRAELAELRQERRPGSGAGGDVSAGPTAELDVRGARAAAVEEGQRKRREYIEALASAFQRERTDASWSPSTTAVVKAALASDQVRQTARQIDCRARTCRVEIAGDPSGTLANVLPFFTMQIAPVLTDMVVDHVTDGRGAVTVLYLTRGDTADDTALAQRHRSDP
jgi:hypothetical protein